MELSNEFEVGVPVGTAWDVLTDVQRIAPCLPGAELREIEGEEYRGVVKVKVGPISAEYRGAAHFVDKDDSSHRAVLRAEGRETRGQGNANATITATLEPSEKGTKVSVVTELQITGKVAQFGRGVLADVSNKILGQFVENLETTVLDAPDTNAVEKSTASRSQPDVATAERNGSSSDGASGDGASGDGSGVRQVQAKPAEPVDLLEMAGAPVARRVLPVIGGVLAVLGALALLRRLRRGSSRR
ncbi:MAG TPA: SRPBCC family protein [Acidimicrobiales bacterium]|nr:SRPBCC family protein [Acidimicrobiales bacterium]